MWRRSGWRDVSVAPVRFTPRHRTIWRSRRSKTWSSIIRMSSYQLGIVDYLEEASSTAHGNDRIVLIKGCSLPPISSPSPCTLRNDHLFVQSVDGLSTERGTGATSLAPSQGDSISDVRRCKFSREISRAVLDAGWGSLDCVARNDWETFEDTWYLAATPQELRRQRGSVVADLHSRWGPDKY